MFKRIREGTGRHVLGNIGTEFENELYNNSRVEEPGFVIGRVQAIVSSPDVIKAVGKTDEPRGIGIVFREAARHAPAAEILTLAKYIANNDVFRAIARKDSALIKSRVISELQSRCPDEQRSQLAGVLSTLGY